MWIEHSCCQRIEGKTETAASSTEVQFKNAFFFSPFQRNNECHEANKRRNREKYLSFNRVFQLQMKSINLVVKAECNVAALEWCVHVDQYKYFFFFSLLLLCVLFWLKALEKWAGHHWFKFRLKNRTKTKTSSKSNGQREFWLIVFITRSMFISYWCMFFPVILRCTTVYGLFNDMHGLVYCIVYTESGVLNVNR